MICACELSLDQSDHQKKHPSQVWVRWDARTMKNEQGSWPGLDSVLQPMRDPEQPCPANRSSKGYLLLCTPRGEPGSEDLLQWQKPWRVHTLLLRTPRTQNNHARRID